jgi:hypothetical protein
VARTVRPKVGRALERSASWPTNGSMVRRRATNGSMVRRRATNGSMVRELHLAAPTSAA